MAFYKNPSDMHKKRAETCKKHGDFYYAKAMKAKKEGRMDDYNSFMAQAQHYYQSMQENLNKIERDTGKEW